jgi:hypothetical protein
MAQATQAKGLGFWSLAHTNAHNMPVFSVTTSGGSDPGFSGTSASRDLGGELVVANTAAGDLPLVRKTVELGSPLILL